MFSNAIVGVEDYEVGRQALGLARALRSADGRITLVYVEAAQTTTSSGYAPRADTERQRFGLERLERLRDEGHVAEEVARIQAPSVRRGLHEFAAERAADLIVIGASRRNRVAQTWLGDETREVLEDPPCAVAVAPTGYPASARLRKIGVAYNGSVESERALALTREFGAGQPGRDEIQVSVFEALPPPVYIGERAGADADADREIQEVREQIAGPGVTEAHVEFAADPVRAIRRYGASVDLLVLGSHAYSAVGRRAHRSTSQRLAENPPSPLLVQPARAAPGSHRPHGG